MQQEDKECVRKVLNYLMYQEKYPDRVTGEMDKGTEELLREALEQNAYEEQDWYGVDRDRRDNVLWKYFLWALLFYSDYLDFSEITMGTGKGK